VSSRSQQARSARPRRTHAVRVAAIATLIIAVVYVAALAIFNVIAANRLVAQVDSQLRDTLGDAQHGVGFAAAVLPDGDDKDVGSPPILLWRITASGHTLAASAGAPPLPASAWSRSGRPQTAQLGTSTFRLKARKAGDVWLVAAQSLANIEHIQRVLLTAEVVAAPVLLGAVFLGTLVIGLKASGPVEQARRRQLEFTADASHELRTPLTTIRGYAELYRANALGPEDLPKAMRRIEQEAERMSMLVAELLELARLDRPSSLDLSETDLTVLAEDAVADARAVEPDREVSTSVPRSLVVTADEPRIRQVLANLLGNVRTHTPPGTPATVRLYPEGSGAVIEVSDQGPGMSEHDAVLAFDRFHRGEGALAAAATGRPAPGGNDGTEMASSGLGLSIVQAIATAHGGHADLTSDPGKGTTVRLWIPRRDQTSDIKRVHASPGPPARAQLANNP
jgi:signal transduction histidine kinase